MSRSLPVEITFLGLMFLGVCSIASGQQSTPLSEGASFDCKKARSRVDKLICSDRQLSTLDREMPGLFALSLTHSSEPGDLKREQRRWIRERDDCEDVTCLATSYEVRIADLAKYTGRLPRTMIQALCARVAAPDTRAQTLEQNAGVEDINNDGEPEAAIACSGGTANLPCASYVDKNNQPVLIQPQGFDWNTYSPLGRAAFRHENHTFIYYSRDAALTQPSHLSYVTPTNREFRMCEFETLVTSAVMEGGHDVCAAVETGEGIEAVELAVSDLDAITSPPRPDTFARHTGIVDIDNDGYEEALVELSYESGGAQGCTFNYFELLAADRKTLERSSKSTPIRELQSLAPEGYRGRNCGNIQNRLFKFGNKIFYETNVANAPTMPHEVRVLDGSASATLCTFERQVTTNVRALFGG